MAQELGIPFTFAGDPDAAGRGLNFSVSGAQSGAAEGMRMRPSNAPCGKDEGLLGRGMQTQVQDFIHSVMSGGIVFQPNSTLFFLAGGLNDGDLRTKDTISNLESEIQALYQAGGRYFFIALLPRRIPSFTPVTKRLDPAIAKIPAELKRSLPDARIALSHWGDYFDQVIVSPAQYGLTNTKDKCAGRTLFSEDPTPCAPPDTYFYFHDGHPSTAVHKIVGSKLADEAKRTFP